MIWPEGGCEQIHSPSVRADALAGATDRVTGRAKPTHPVGMVDAAISAPQGGHDDRSLPAFHPAQCSRPSWPRLTAETQRLHPPALDKPLAAHRCGARRLVCRREPGRAERNFAPRPTRAVPTLSAANVSRRPCMRALMNSARAGMPRSAAAGTAASKPSGFGFSAGGEELARRPWPRPCPLWLGHGGKQHRRKCASCFVERLRGMGGVCHAYYVTVLSIRAQTFLSRSPTQTPLMETKYAQSDNDGCSCGLGCRPAVRVGGRAEPRYSTVSEGKDGPFSIGRVVPEIWHQLDHKGSSSTVPGRGRDLHI